MSVPWRGGQYSVFRALFGAYLFVHFAQLLPFAAELFSSAGMLADAGLSPLFGVFPSPFAVTDDPFFVEILVGSAAVAAALYAIGWHDKPAAVWMWFTLAWLFGRNPLIANPSLPYTGWMLLAHLCIPSAPCGSWSARGSADAAASWHFPAAVHFAAWTVLALSYSYSGYTKLLSPSWVSGDTIAYVLQNPLARDYFLRDLFLGLPDGVLRALTWAILSIELLFAPLALFRRLRPWLWSGMLAVQCGFALLLNFPDLTVAMLLFHLFTLDPAWIGSKARSPDEVVGCNERSELHQPSR